MEPTEHTASEEMDWDDLLEALSPVDFLLLEQVYVVERAPMSLRTLQRRLTYLNLHERTVTRHAWGLASRRLVDLVSSCETILNPIPRLEVNVERLVKIWRLREQLSLACHMNSVGQRTFDDIAS